MKLQHSRNARNWRTMAEGGINVCLDAFADETALPVTASFIGDLCSADPGLWEPRTGECYRIID